MLQNLSSVSEPFFQQLWIKIQCKKLKSFLLCATYRLPSTPVHFLVNLKATLMESLLLGLDIIILGDLNCNLLSDCRDGRALMYFCSNSNVVQLVKAPTRITETSETLIDVALTTNEAIVYDCNVKFSTISNHSLVSLSLNLKPPKPRPIYIYLYQEL